MDIYSLEFAIMDCVKRIKRSVDFVQMSNALDMARRVAACADVVGEIVIVNAMTGEVMYSRENGKEKFAAFD